MSWLCSRHSAESPRHECRQAGSRPARVQTLAICTVCSLRRITKVTSEVTLLDKAMTVQAMLNCKSENAWSMHAIVADRFLSDVDGVVAVVPLLQQQQSTVTSCTILD